MRKVKQIKGVDKLMRNLNRELRQIKGRSIQGMIKAAAFIRSDMEKVPPLIPLDTGNLRASWFVTSGSISGRPFVQMGFTAEYAFFVHEMMGNNIDWNRPGSGGKFLESALRRNHERIIDIIAQDAKIR